MKFVLKCSVDKNPAMAPIMVCNADKATSHHLNQSWPDLLTHICATRERWVIKIPLSVICTIDRLQNIHARNWNIWMAPFIILNPRQRQTYFNFLCLFTSPPNDDEIILQYYIQRWHVTSVIPIAVPGGTPLVLVYVLWPISYISHNIVHPYISI